MTNVSRSYSPGPWWWRLRCWLAQRVMTLGGWLEPEDRVTEHEELPDGRLRFFDARRPYLPPAGSDYCGRCGGHGVRRAGDALVRCEDCRGGGIALREGE